MESQSSIKSQFSTESQLSVEAISANRHGFAVSSQPPAAALLAQITADELLLTAKQCGHKIHQWAISPNELHILVALQAFSGSRPDPAQQHRPNATREKPRALTTFIASFKAASAKRINLLRNQLGSPVWQRSYSEQLITDPAILSLVQSRIYNMDNVVLASQKN